MKQATALLGLLAETSIHAGAGHSVGAIDLPIQREAHSDWPCIFGSAVKGAMRTRAHDQSMSKSDRIEIFGPDPEDNNASDHAGALTVTDARLLLLPVRSLTGHFKWVTCPALLRRLGKDLNRLGLGTDKPFGIPSVSRDQALMHPTGKEARIPEERLFLEELRLEIDHRDLGNIIERVSSVLPDPDARELLRQQLVIVGDDLFSHLARFATPVAAHVRIDNLTKTVQDGALWYEETLPSETVLYVGLTAWRARKQGVDKAADEILQACLDGLFSPHSYLQMGGNETVGMGWCRVRTLGAES